MTAKKTVHRKRMAGRLSMAAKTYARALSIDECRAKLVDPSYVDRLAKLLPDIPRDEIAGHVRNIIAGLDAERRLVVDAVIAAIKGRGPA